MKTTKEKIIDTSIHYFCTQGYRKSTLRKIAEDVGIAEASIFSHYSSKNEIAAVIIKKYIKSIESLTDTYFKDLPYSTEEFAVYLWCLHYKILDDSTYFTDFYLEFYKRAEIDFIQQFISYPSKRTELRSNSKKQLFVDYSVLVAIDIKIIELLHLKKINLTEAIFEIAKFLPLFYEIHNNLFSSEDEIKAYLAKNFKDSKVDIQSILTA